LSFNSFINYIDPGTGSMLLTVILGLATTLVFVFRGFLIKFKYKILGGKTDADLSRKDIILFSDHKRYWNVFRPLCDELEKSGADCAYWTMSPDDPGLQAGYDHIKCEFIGEGSKGFARLNTMKAYICTATTPGLDVLQWKRSKDVNWYVHIYHAAGDNLGYRMFALDYYDAVLETGDVQTRGIRTLESLRGLPAKELVIAGSTYLDDMKARADALKPVTDNNKGITVLLAPSWGESSILSKYGAQFITALTATGYNIIIRPHPQSLTAQKEMLDSLMTEFPENSSLSWNFDNDNFNVLSRSDIMISDYSGVIFDYTFIFDRPVMFADVSMNRAPYDSAWVDYVPWTLDILPCLGKKLDSEDFPRMKEVIDEVLSSDIYKEGREKARNEAWQFIGEGARRSAQYLVSKLSDLKADRNEKADTSVLRGDRK